MKHVKSVDRFDLTSSWPDIKSTCRLLPSSVKFSFPSCPDLPSDIVPTRLRPTHTSECRNQLPRHPGEGSATTELNILIKCFDKVAWFQRQLSEVIRRQWRRELTDAAECLHKNRLSCQNTSLMTRIANNTKNRDDDEKTSQTSFRGMPFFSCRCHFYRVLSLSTFFRTGARGNNRL